MMYRVRQVCRYMLWMLVGMALAMLLLGLMRFNFSISQYMDYLNAVDIHEVSFANPGSIVDIFVPGQEKINTIQNEGDLTIQTGSVMMIGTGSITGDTATGDAEFEDFFADFDEKDFADLSTDSGFGFSGDILAEPISGEQTPTIETVLTDEQKQLLLQRLQSRKDRELTPSQIMIDEDE